MKKICEYCKKEFETENKRVKYCSKECKAHAYNLRRKEKSLQPSGKYRCLNCGKDFDYISGQGSHKFCTSDCKFTYIAALGKLTKKLHAEQDPNYAKNVQNRRRNTCLQRYGVDHVAKSAVIKQKTRITNLKKYKNANGIDFSKIDFVARAKKELITKKKNGTLLSIRIEDPIEHEKMYGEAAQNKIKQTKMANHTTQFELCKNKEWKDNRDIKEHNTKKKNKTFNTSRDETYVENTLRGRFPNTRCQYKSSLYPFNCDFYIPEKDLYIEYQGHWTHGKHPFNKNDLKDITKLESWKSKNNQFYKNAIKVWTIRDPLKRKTAKENNLNWLEFFTMKDFEDWFNLQKVD